MFHARPRNAENNDNQRRSGRRGPRLEGEFPGETAAGQYLHIKGTVEAKEAPFEGEIALSLVIKRFCAPAPAAPGR